MNFPFEISIKACSIEITALQQQPGKVRLNYGPGIASPHRE
jgi:hypothetical protein